jgi:hypothetical protein
MICAQSWYLPLYWDFFPESEGMKMDRFPYLCSDFALGTAGARLYLSSFLAEQLMPLLTYIIMRTLKKQIHVHY